MNRIMKINGIVSLLVFIAVLSIIVAGCSLFEKPDTKIVYETEYYSENIEGLLTAGYRSVTNASAGSTLAPVLWDGAEETLLSHNGYGGAVQACAYYNGVAYAAGYVLDLSGLHQVPALWIGGELAILPCDGADGSAEALFVDASGVYAAGWQTAETDPLSELACYWTAGLATGTEAVRHALNSPEPNLEQPHPQSRALAVSVIDGTVYTAGYYHEPRTDAHPTPCYWTGSDRTNILNYGFGNVTCIAVNASGEPVFGGFWHFNDDRYRPCIWSGTDRTPLFPDSDAATEDFDGAVCDLEYNGTELYAAGWYADTAESSVARPAYWIDGSMEYLPHGSGSETVTGIAFSGGRTFFCGRYSAGGYESACLWSDNIRYYFSEVFTESGANSVVNY